LELLEVEVEVDSVPEEVAALEVSFLLQIYCKNLLTKWTRSWRIPAER